VLVRSVPLEGGACPEPEAADPAARASAVVTVTESTALGTLLDAAPRAGLDLPCRSGEADLWFAESPAELERAKALCGGCPVRAACLAGALDREEPWGVWGGEIFERGVVVPRKRPRGRPSKADLARDRAYAAAAAAAALSA
jgi:WhiB family transcriptional regulator, redox-sensing transcriptional regulator